MDPLALTPMPQLNELRLGCLCRKHLIDIGGNEIEEIDCLV